MTIEFRCSQCSQRLRVPDDAAGKNARCPKCQALMMVPASAAQPSVEPSSAAGGFAALPSQTPPVVPPPNDPFAGLPGTSASSPPPKPLGGVPMGGGPAAPFSSQSAANINPYAAPTEAAFAYGT